MVRRGKPGWHCTAWANVVSICYSAVLAIFNQHCFSMLALGARMQYATQDALFLLPPKR